MANLTRNYVKTAAYGRRSDDLLHFLMEFVLLMKITVLSDIRYHLSASINKNRCEISMADHYVEMNDVSDDRLTNFAMIL